VSSHKTVQGTSVFLLDTPEFPMGLGDPVSIGDGIRFRLGWKGGTKGKGKSFSMGPSPCEVCCEKAEEAILAYAFTCVLEKKTRLQAELFLSRVRFHR